MEGKLQRVLDYIDQNRDAYVSLLQRFCRQPSVAATGEGMEAMARMVQEELTLLGAAPERVETGGSPVIYAHVSGEADRTLGFYNHYDVQPPDPIGEWIADPYAAEIIDGFIYARGAVDNKGGLAARIAAVDAWRKVGGKLPLHVKFLVEGEEEIGSPHLVQFARDNPDRIRCDGYMWEGGSKDPDGPPEIALGAKGMLYVELFSDDGAKDAHSANASILQSMPWRLVWALGTLKDAQENILIEGFYDGIPPLTPMELEALDTDIIDLEQARKDLGGAKLLPGLSREALLTRLYYKPTCNICGLTTGYQGEGSKTILPGSASAKLDFRLVPGQDPDRILRLLREHLDKHGFGDIRVQCHSGCPSYRTDPKSPFARAAVGALERLYGKPACVRHSESGTSPMYAFCAETQIPAAMFGATNKGSNIHAPNERLGVDNFLQNIKITAAVMEEFSTY